MTRRNFAKITMRDRMRRQGAESIAGAAQLPCGYSPRPKTAAVTKQSEAEAFRVIAEVDKFWRDRAGRAIVVRLTEFSGHPLVDVRTFYTADGKLCPAKGFACGVKFLPQLAKSIQKAIGEAQRLGLLPQEEGRQ